MTLAMALRAIDGLVLATDSRVTGPEGTADTSEKFLQVNRDIGVLTYGLAQPGYAGITRLVSAVNVKRLARFGEISSQAQRSFAEAVTEWLKDKSKDTLPGLLVGFILAGYDSVERNQFRIMHYEARPDPGGPPVVTESEMPGDLLAAQWHVSGYLLSKFYYPTMTVARLAELAVFVMAETMTIEESVGGAMQMAIITRATGFRRLEQQWIQQALESCQDRFARFVTLCRQVALS